MVKTAKQPMREGAEVSRKVMAAAIKSGGGRNDPLVRARRALRRRHGPEVSAIEERVRAEVREALSRAQDDEVPRWRG